MAVFQSLIDNERFLPQFLGSAASILIFIKTTRWTLSLSVFTLGKPTGYSYHHLLFIPS